MRKKGFVPDSSVSVLLTVPEGVGHERAAKAFLSEQGGEHVPQVLVFNTEEETLTIGLVRELIEHTAYARAKSEPQALVICAVHTAGIPAQNALLKIVEEPSENAQIILVARPGHSLLPTLISRCREVLWTETEEGSASDGSETNGAGESSEALVVATQTLSAFLADPTAFAHHQLITLAEQFKDSDSAKRALRSALTPRDHITTLPAPIAQELLHGLSALEKNGNVRLTLEHTFFAIKAAGSTQNR